MRVYPWHINGSLYLLSQARTPILPSASNKDSINPSARRIAYMDAKIYNKVCLHCGSRYTFPYACVRMKRARYIVPAFNASAVVLIPL
jgi:hypothetical protein